MTLDPNHILKVDALTKSVTLANKSGTASTSNNTLELLKPISLNVTKGDSLAIIGSSGSGKTTLLSLLAGLDTPSSGQVYLKDHALHQLDEEQRSQVRANHVGFIFQQFLLINSLTALENVMLPGELAQQENPVDRAQQLLEKVGLGDRAHHFPGQLSGGEQQRVAIARAFMAQPEVLFADEPTGNLDSKTGELITNLLFELNEQYGATLILVTHDPKLAKRCNRTVVMDSGQLIEEIINDSTNQKTSK